MPAPPVDGHHTVLDFVGTNGTTKGCEMNVFIVEDTAIMLENLLSILFDIPGVAVVGHAVGGADAVERIDALRPDLVILNIGLRNGAGIGMLERLKKRHPRIKVMVLTGCTDEFYSDRCKRAGADYFFDKVFQLTWVRAALRQWGEASAPGDELGVWQVSGWRNDPVTV